MKKMLTSLFFIHFMSKYNLSYSKHGTEKEVICLFHGFGQDRNVFNSWLPELTKKHTVYAFDLFYHGESTRAHSTLSREEWKRNFNEFLIEGKIEKFSVLGFSLGGRFAISTALALPERINHLFLLAPDAVYRTPWYRLATSPGLKRIFRYYMFRPDRMDRLISRGLKLGIICRYIANFVRLELGSIENKKLIYFSWNHFKPLGYSHWQLRKKFKKSVFKKTLILGKQDFVIPTKKILPILKGCGFDVITLDKKHHQLVKEDVVNSILR